jgi:serine phosphatase RsbU (regulator of sigma subunit)
MNKKLHLLSIIPDEYRLEYHQQEASLIKNRVKMLCLLTVVLYFAANLLSNIIGPHDFRLQEIWVWIALVLTSIIILIFNNFLSKIRFLRFNAYLFIILVFFLLTRMNFIYYDYFDVSILTYLFAFFLVCFTIPWRPSDVILITIAAITSYSILYHYIKPFYITASVIEKNLQYYVDGLIVLFLSFILCSAVRRKETERDIENFLLVKEIENKNKQMQRELELATMVHKTLIPKSVSTDKVDVAVLYKPVYYIGGDYAKFHFIDNDKLLFIICDITGHGVSAALLVNRLHAEFERLARSSKQPGALLKDLNRFIISEFKGTNMYLTAFCCLLDFKRMVMTYSNHGHPGQYVYRSTDGKIECLVSQGGLLGLSLIAKKRVFEHNLKFSENDKIVLFTDGAIELRDESGREFGKKRLEKFILDNNELEANKFNNNLLKELTDYTCKAFDDDICIITIQIKKGRANA